MHAMKSPHRQKKCFVPLALTWTHCGTLYRVTAWPEARFECCYGDEWIPTSPTEDALASAAQSCGADAWKPYLDFVGADVREFLARFGVTRMEVLQVAARCPALVHELNETPALTAFIAAHPSLRGTLGVCWEEINAVYDRSGIFGLLEWLGLPSSRQTLSVLQNIVECDVPKRFLEPLRSLLWEPTALFVLQRMPAITDRELAKTCHALAA
jgi:hypothetical protein